MPFRRDISWRTRMLRQADAIVNASGEPAVYGCAPLARSAFERLRAEGSASADCAERVAEVLQKLGYGFAMIPRGKSTPQHS